jgi:hypothetical protein
MKRGKSPKARPATRRTTLTLPAEYLEKAEKLAHAQHATVSSVVTRALAIGLPHVPSPKRAGELLESYRKAFDGFSEEELLLLDGIVLEPIGPDNPDPHDDED